jgi:hypothetical protein
MTDEVQAYLAHLDSMRQAVREVLLGLAEDGLNWRPLPEQTNSVYNLAQHVAWVEQWQIGHLLGRQPFPYDWSAGQDLRGTGEDAADLLFWLDEAATSTRAVLETLTATTLGENRPRDDHEVSVRWLILHTIDHYAEHLGQMRLTRQLWEARQ